MGIVSTGLLVLVFFLIRACSEFQVLPVVAPWIIRGGVTEHGLSMVN